MKKRARDNSWSVNSGREEAEQVGGDTEGEGDLRRLANNNSGLDSGRGVKKIKKKSAQREEAWGGGEGGLVFSFFSSKMGD